MNLMLVSSGTMRNSGRRNMADLHRQQDRTGADIPRTISSRATRVAVNRVVTMPTVIVTAKPRTGPEPNTNSITCARNAVALLSMIVAVGAAEPGLQRVQRRAPVAHLLADALVDQDVGVHRHAEGQQDARPCPARSASPRAATGPRSAGTGWRPARRSHTSRTARRTTAMKAITSTSPTASAMAPARMLSAPSSGPTLRSSITVSGAGSAPARSSTARSLRRLGA